ncbi:NAD(P)-dependent oxidoreductase [Bradyrhizobium sp. LHD-71]|uniref:NAD-dependent epimerase/dehydratase family protein n=1 Tax=Bradyrhizobium sp. LHD-71 TaxID=3072141 RepID=UPI00280D3C73|nr:NAD(P)-dependent oxidoreductase [Bradyrhizobium sp. LHD-71]MDQ8732145.1 NAD(P)-dependent oxidoreductase [Bradyrhizobium sp. LHD-71]
MLSDKKVLVTGAAGHVGQWTRKCLQSKVGLLRLSDIAPLKDAAENEEIRPCDLTDAQDLERLVTGIDYVVHLGASLNVDDWPETLRVNIEGTYNLYEAARRAGVKRIAYASSHHVIGMYPVGQTLGLDAPMRPDSLYGLSKCFGENLARYYWDKFGLESVCWRIGTARPRPGEIRELSTWLSEQDYERLLLRSLQTPAIGFLPVYGISANRDAWWDNGQARALEFEPQDDATRHAQPILDAPADSSAQRRYPLQGGKRAEHRRAAEPPTGGDGGRG